MTGPEAPPAHDVTVAICTRNRAAELRTTLSALGDQRLPGGTRWEILAIDNGSSDRTPEVLDELARDLPLRAVREARTGLSHARNRAVREASGALIVWTDDDVTVGPDWVASHHRAARSHPDAAFFGGSIEPDFAEPPPAWITRAWTDVALFFAAREARPGRSVTADYVPFGANLSVRRDVQRKYPFDPSLGRSGTLLRSGEEYDVLERMLADGVRGRWIDAPVLHRIPPHRASLPFVRGVAAEMGRAGAEALLRPGQVRPWGRPLRVWRDFLSAHLRYRFARVLAGPERWVPLAIDAAFQDGRFDAIGAPGRESRA